MVLVGEDGQLKVDAKTGFPMNKGLRTVGFERGHWDAAGKIADLPKALSLKEMRDVLRKDPDFAYNPTILEQGWTRAKPYSGVAN